MFSSRFCFSFLASQSALSATMAVAMQRPCGLCPLPCRGDRAPFRLYPAGNKEGMYSHDSCIKAAKKKRNGAAAALAQPDADAAASSAAVASAVKKQKTDTTDADTGVTARGSTSTDEVSPTQALSSSSSEAAACPAVASSPSSNAADAAQLLFALHTRYIFTALLCALCFPCGMFLASHSTLFSVAAICKRFHSSAATAAAASPHHAAADVNQHSTHGTRRSHGCGHKALIRFSSAVAVGASFTAASPTVAAASSSAILTCVQQIWHAERAIHVVQ